jgi:hypothetical protein
MTRHRRDASMTRLPVAVLLIAGIGWAVTACSKGRAAEAGFWFEDVTYQSPRLGGSITAADLATIETIARSELAEAFSGLRIAWSNRRDARFKVRVVQRLRDDRFRRQVEVAGESRAIVGFGGHGAVSFAFLASGAIAYAPDNADRDAIIDAIGTGIGRAAVHEFTHQLLPTTSIHSANVRSYEYASAARPEQYFGEMEWDTAWPLLHRRIGS